MFKRGRGGGVIEVWVQIDSKVLTSRNFRDAPFIFYGVARQRKKKIKKLKTKKREVH